MKFRYLLLTLVFAVTSFIARADNGIGDNPPGVGEESKKNDIAGGVIHADSKKPLNNVSVTAYSTTKKEKVVWTDGSGNYAFNELKPGTYKLVYEKDGFKKVTREKVITRPDEGCQINVEMNEEANFQIIPGVIFDFN